jgi:hypothetical protein
MISRTIFFGGAPQTGKGKGRLENRLIGLEIVSWLCPSFPTSGTGSWNGVTSIDS